MPRPGRSGARVGLGSPVVPLHLFADISLDVDTGRTGKVKRSHGDKVGLSWLPQDGRVDRQTWGWSWGGVGSSSRRVMDS